MKEMTIGIVGLGLIGGSLAKAIKDNTEHTILGFDIKNEVLKKARLVGAIDDELLEENIPLCDMLIIALYPQAAIDFVKKRCGKDIVFMCFLAVEFDALDADILVHQ